MIFLPMLRYQAATAGHHLALPLPPLFADMSELSLYDDGPLHTPPTAEVAYLMTCEWEVSGEVSAGSLTLEMPTETQALKDGDGEPIETLSHWLRATGDMSVETFNFSTGSEHPSIQCSIHVGVPSNPQYVSSTEKWKRRVPFIYVNYTNYGEGGPPFGVVTVYAYGTLVGGNAIEEGVQASMSGINIPMWTREEGLGEVAGEISIRPTKYIDLTR